MKDGSKLLNVIRCWLQAGQWLSGADGWRLADGWLLRSCSSFNSYLKISSKYSWIQPLGLCSERLIERMCGGDFVTRKTYDSQIPAHERKNKHLNSHRASKFLNERFTISIKITEQLFVVSDKAAERTFVKWASKLPSECWTEQTVHARTNSLNGAPKLVIWASKLLSAPLTGSVCISEPSQRRNYWTNVQITPITRDEAPNSRRNYCTARAYEPCTASARMTQYEAWTSLNLK